MNHKYIYTSLTRISDLSERPFAIQAIPRSKWGTGDYVVVKIIDAGGYNLQLELTSGRMRSVMGDEWVIGTLGERFATLEATGTWKMVEDDLKMHVLTAAGLLGKLTSKSLFLPNMIEVIYLGHVCREGRKVCMEDFVKPSEERSYSTPTILFMGTSMSAGKTTSARITTRLFKMAGLKVLGAKLTGAGRYKDILAVKDVGADAVYDFVDVGLPSSICDRDKFAFKTQQLLNRIQAEEADIAIIEIGASPLEPYNGDVAIKALGDNVKCTILSASDPYAVHGLMKAFDIVPDVVTGIATNTLAGSTMVEKLCGVLALNLLDPSTTPELKKILKEKTGMKL